MRRGSLLGRVAVVLVPAVIVASLYVLAFWRPQNAVLAATKQQYTAANSGAPDAATIERALARKAALQAEVQAATAAKVQTSATAGPVVPMSSRAHWRLQLSDVLARHSLVLVGEERTDLELPAHLSRALNGGAATGATRWPAWSLRLHGGYLDVLAAIGSLREAMLPCHVLDLQMQRDQAGMIWTLVVG